MGRSSGRPRRRRVTGRHAFLRGLDASVTGNAKAFGYSITITVAYAAVSVVHGEPSLPQVLGFALSAVAAFSGLNLVVSRFMDVDVSQVQARRVVLVATATDVLAVAAAVGTAAGVSMVTGGWLPWLLAPFLASLAYVLVQAVELTVGQVEVDPGDE